jgi:hypothetical protein
MAAAADSRTRNEKLSSRYNRTLEASWSRWPVERSWPLPRTISVSAVVSGTERPSS